MGKSKKNVNFIVTALLAAALLLGMLWASVWYQKKTSEEPKIPVATVPILAGQAEDKTDTTETTTEPQTQAPNTEPSEASTEQQTEITTAEQIPAETKPPVKAKRAYQGDFDRLREKYRNDDIIGIVKIPGTVVYYPVVHHDESNEYYLERDLYKNKSSAGSICLDYENSVERHDPNTILYGHQMSSNSMFHTLSYYNDANFFWEHRYIIFNTIYENSAWEVFAFFKTDVSFNYIKVFFRSERDFLSLAAEMSARSLYDTGIEIKEGDRILTLSTCTNIEQDTRYVLVARMIKNKSEIPDDIAVQLSGAAQDFDY
ncbi:MAG: class B sortase [Oscillospiraceae bacterium]|nr:class B sortase [Oscillospiraceae bacterium]